MKKSLLALSAALAGASALAGAPAANLSAGGPPVSFARQGAQVCASYKIDGSFELYQERVFARSGAAKAALSGLPQGKSKPGAPASEAIIQTSFKACAKAASESAPMEWIDQSCAAGQGLCLPPRGILIDASGKASPMDPAKAGAAFGELMGMPASSAGAAGWGSMSFKPR